MIDWQGKAQPALARAGLYKGKIDGDDGPATYAALLMVIADKRARPEDITAMARALARFAGPLAGLTTPARLANYIGQTGNETGGFTEFIENMNYSATRLAQVWPGRYAVDPKAKTLAPNAKAKKLAGDPVALSNDVYGARMGNELDGLGDNDGWDFRGAGPLGNTGFSNFLAAEKLTGIPFSVQPGLMAHPGLGTIGCLAWWSTSGINPYLDRGDSIAARSIANAGNPNAAHPEGIERVTAYERKLLAILS